MILLLIIPAMLVILTVLFMRQAKFGKAPAGERLKTIQRSPHYRNGKFHNLSDTPDLTEGATFFSILKDFIFNRSKQSAPPAVLPSVKTNLLSLDKDRDVLVWFGHSSYFMQVDGKRILVDPVLSGSASPLRFTTRSFPGADVYAPDELPVIDYLFITHDHWDHLDHDTLLKLKPKIGKIITGMGTGAHLEHWGFSTNIIIEKDWNEQVDLEDGFVVNTVPARHFSGRGFKRQQSLWLSFVLQTPTLKIFIGGDSGYDTHFAETGKRFGPFDLAILECGQYNKSWKHIHMTPEELVQAAADLQARRFIPVHWAKFSLALHSWDDPIRRVTAAAAQSNIPILHPMIGEAVDLQAPVEGRAWWEAVK
jgi:L-ascorbate metabolism protein UlaG (beta-lactamase superfamily)